MLANYLLILLKSGIPVALISFGLVWWAQRKNYLGGAASLKEYELWKSAENRSRKEAKKLLKAQKKQRKSVAQTVVADQPSVPTDPHSQQPERKFDFVHSKWMSFGGGFYGVVALLTYLFVELAEMRDFLLKLPNLFEHSLVSLVVNFFVESLRNFVTAIAWPAYWLKRIHSEQWLWFFGAYAGYWLGTYAAFRIGSRRISEFGP